MKKIAKKKTAKKRSTKKKTASKKGKSFDKRIANSTAPRTSRPEVYA
ncbi:MAG: hypothetical protein [Mu-like cryoconite phage AB09]|nr:MAG: hypothetical protein [Mu-like cryoconite phage AB09]